MLELGAGAGRVALHLAGHGYDVIALERDADLAAELERLAADRGVSLTTLTRDLDFPDGLRLPRRPQLAIGPLHVIQVLDSRGSAAAPGAPARARWPRRRAGGSPWSTSPRCSAPALHRRQILPDMREVEGWVYSSEPLWVQVGEQVLTVRRLRERVSPDGEHRARGPRRDPPSGRPRSPRARGRRRRLPPDRQAVDQLGRRRGRLGRGPLGSPAMSRELRSSGCSRSIPSR